MLSKAILLTACATAIPTAWALNYARNVTYSFGSGANAGPGNVVNVTFTYSGANAGPNGLPSSVSTIPIKYRTGSVMTGTVNVYLIYYGSKSTLFDYFGKNNGLARTIIEDFINNLSGTAYFDVARRYGVGNVRVAKSVYVECNNRAFAYGCDIGINYVEKIIYEQIYKVYEEYNAGWRTPVDSWGYGLPKDPNGMYLVIGGPETTEAFANDGSGAKAGRDYCAYHSTFSSVHHGWRDNNVYKYGYAHVPNLNPINVGSIMTSLNEVGGIKPASRCFFPRNTVTSPNGDPAADQVIGQVAHEVIEILVSPDARTTWYDDEMNEVMDKCDTWFSDLQSLNGFDWNLQAGNRKYLVSPVWDPITQTCAMQTTSKVREGASVKCSASDPNVYRFQNTQISLYPDPSTASSWDPNWSSFTVIDCNPYPKAGSLPLLREGMPVKCSASEATIYRYTNYQLRAYPTAAIASSWDSNYGAFTVIDCSGVSVGGPMTFNAPEGAAVKCSAADPPIYRFTGGQLRHYPDPTIASSWDSSWWNFRVIDCSFLVTGRPMPIRRNIPEGVSVKCSSSDPNVYRFQSTKISLYPDPSTASSWDPNWSSFTVIDCNPYPKAGSLPLLREGMPVKCSASEATIYRYTNYQLRAYPTAAIASSWDSNYGAFTVIDCSGVSVGGPMTFNAPEGAAVKCSAADPPIYRFTGGQLRHYPDPTIASSWDSNWGNPRVIDCSFLVTGRPMPRN